MVPSYLIALLVVASLLLVAGFAYYFMVHTKKPSDGSIGGSPIVSLAVTHPTRDYGRVICPTGFNTNYVAGYAGEAQCDQTKGCNMCIGKGIPKDYTAPDGTVKPWPGRNWTFPSGQPSTYSKPSCGGADSGAIMHSYTGEFGDFLVTPLPGTGCSI